MKKSVKAMIVIGIVAVIGGAAVFGASRARGGADQATRNAPMVEVEKTHRETIITKVKATGTVSFREMENVYAGNTAKVDTMDIHAGDQVEAGQVLLTYDGKRLEDLEESLKDAELSVKSARLGVSGASLPSSETEVLQAQSSVDSAEKTIKDLQGQVNSAQNSLEQAQRNLQTAEDSYVKNKTLYEQGLLSKNELDRSENAVKDAEDQLKSAQTQINNLENSMKSAESSLAIAQKQYNTVVNKTSDSKVKNQISLQQVSLEQADRQVEKIQKQISEFKTQEVSPISGTVISVNVTPGQSVTEGLVLFVIADTSSNNLVITDFIPENEAKNIAVDQDVEISGGALGSDVYKGKLSKIFPTASKQQLGNNMETAITVEVSPADNNIPLKSGYTVETSIITNVAENVVVVPLMAVVTESGNASYVYVVDENNKAYRRNVELKNYSNLYVEALGIEEGESVILNPSYGLEDGTLVNPVSVN